MLREMQALYRRMTPLHHVVIIYLRQNEWAWGLLEQRRRAVSNQRPIPTTFTIQANWACKAPQAIRIRALIAICTNPVGTPYEIASLISHSR